MKLFSIPVLFSPQLALDFVHNAASTVELNSTKPQAQKITVKAFVVVCFPFLHFPLRISVDSNFLGNANSKHVLHQLLNRYVSIIQHKHCVEKRKSREPTTKTYEIKLGLKCRSISQVANLVCQSLH